VHGDVVHVAAESGENGYGESLNWRAPGECLMEDSLLV
jgi:hypothetical protein